jgi:predicted nucleic acid-binding Zn ribbon protein
MKQFIVEAKNAILAYFRGTRKHCSECGAVFVPDDKWCRTCGSRRRKRSLLTRLMVFNASVGAFLLLLLGALHYLTGLINPDLVERAIAGEYPFFTIWFYIGVGFLSSLMPLILLKRFWMFLTT